MFGKRSITVVNVFTVVHCVHCGWRGEFNGQSTIAWILTSNCRLVNLTPECNGTAVTWTVGALSAAGLLANDNWYWNPTRKIEGPGYVGRPVGEVCQEVFWGDVQQMRSWDSKPLFLWTAPCLIVPMWNADVNNGFEQIPGHDFALLFDRQRSPFVIVGHCISMSYFLGTCQLYQSWQWLCSGYTQRCQDTPKGVLKCWNCQHKV